jgi:hypothetical protein
MSWDAMDECADCGKTNCAYQSSYSFGILRFCSPDCHRAHYTKNVSLLNRANLLQINDSLTEPSENTTLASVKKSENEKNRINMNALVTRVLDHEHLEVFYPLTNSLDIVRLHSDSRIAKPRLFIGDERENKERTLLMQHTLLSSSSLPSVQEYCKNGSSTIISDNPEGIPYCPKKKELWDIQTEMSKNRTVLEQLAYLWQKEQEKSENERYAIKTGISRTLSLLLSQEQKGLQTELLAVQGGLIVFLPTDEAWQRYEAANPSKISVENVLRTHILTGKTRVVFGKGDQIHTPLNPLYNLKLVHLKNADGVTRNFIQLLRTGEETKIVTGKIEQMCIYNRDGIVFKIDTVLAEPFFNPQKMEMSLSSTPPSTTRFLANPFLFLVSHGIVNVSKKENKPNFLSNVSSVSLVDAFVATTESSHCLTNLLDYITAQWANQHLVASPSSISDSIVIHNTGGRICNERKFKSTAILHSTDWMQTLNLRGENPLSKNQLEKLQLCALQDGNGILASQCAWAAQF